MTPAAGARRGTPPVVWVQGLLCGGALALATSASLLVGVLLAPGLAALAIDRTPGKPVARAILLYGAAGAATPFAAFWRRGQDFAAGIDLLTDPTALALAWTAAAFGWLLAEAAPLAVRLVLEARSLARTASLREARREWEEEWDLPPAGEGSTRSGVEPVG